ncbi:MAG: hypothetical protein KKE73_16225, partial [Proteobacteria bacterium]|nr:hypothetical protein [Pseudomonadota bacterium]
IATSCRTQWVQKLIQEKQVQYTGIIDLFQPQNVSKLYIQCNFFTDLGSPSRDISIFCGVAPPLSDSRSLPVAVS